MSVKSKKTPPSGYKKMQCKYCDTICERVDNKATAVTCWKCTQTLVNGGHLEKRN
jgi:ribosomal protein S27E